MQLAVKFFGLFEVEAVAAFFIDDQLRFGDLFFHVFPGFGKEGVSPYAEEEKGRDTDLPEHGTIVAVAKVVVDAGTEGSWGSEAFPDQPVEQFFWRRFIEVVFKAVHAEAVTVGL